MVRNDIIERHVAEHQATIADVLAHHVEAIDQTGAIMSEALDRGGTLFWCGNGGSAADSQHLAAELVGRFKHNRQALRSVALTTDSSVLTCIANDYSYQDIFSRQVEALGRAGDVLIVISTSGASENILRALRQAKAQGLTTLALLGKGGGEAKNLADRGIVILSNSTARIQEAHILVGHIWCDLIERNLNVA